MLPFSTKDTTSSPARGRAGSSSSTTSSSSAPASSAASAGMDGPLSGWFGEPEADPLCPTFTLQQRLMGFFVCFALSAFCFAISWALIPVLVLKARKFALLFSFGSVMAMSAMAMLRGPKVYITFMLNRNNMSFTTMYASSLIATIYVALILRSTFLTIPFAGAQMVALVLSMARYVPGGVTGIKSLLLVCYKTTMAVLLPTVKVCLPVNL